MSQQGPPAVSSTRFTAPFKFTTSAGKELTLRQDKVNYEDMNTVGNIIWAASTVLAKYIEDKDAFPDGFWVNKKVLTLGSGTGLDCIALRLLGAHVVATDINVTLLESNIKANLGNVSNITVEKLGWGDEDDLRKFTNQEFDFIVACDVIYFPHLVPPLVETISRLASKTTVVYVICECHNMYVMQSFLDNAEGKLEVKEIMLDFEEELFSGHDFRVWKIAKL